MWSGAWDETIMRKVCNPMISVNLLHPCRTYFYNCLLFREAVKKETKSLTFVKPPSGDE